MDQDFVLHYERPQQLFLFAESEEGTAIAQALLQQPYECRVRIKVVGATHGATTVVVVSPTLASRTVGVTNMIEWIATAICRQLALAPGRVLWLEHYPAEKTTYLTGEDLAEREEFECNPERFSLVTFTWSVDPAGNLVAAEPDWQDVSHQWVEALLREDLPAEAWVIGS